MYVDIQDTTIQLLPGAMISAAGGPGGSGNPLLLAAPGGGVPGLFAPFDPVYNGSEHCQSPASTRIATTAPPYLRSVWWPCSTTFGSTMVTTSHGFPSTPMTLAGDNFNLGGQAMSVPRMVVRPLSRPWATTPMSLVNDAEHLLWFGR